MNSKEAKRVLSDISKAYRNFSKEEIRALELAIRSLEACEKVKSELKSEIARLDAQFQETWILEWCIELIDKELKEVCTQDE